MTRNATKCFQPILLSYPLVHPEKCANQMMMLIRDSANEVLKQ